MTTAQSNSREAQPAAPQWWQAIQSHELSIFVTAVIVVLTSAILYALAKSSAVVDDFAANVITEAIGVAITVVAIERLNWKRNMIQRKEELILQMGSTDNVIALEAVRLLRHYGWLEDGSLQEVEFWKADLREAQLFKCNLQGARFHLANLKDVNLAGANLRDALLWQANLQGAELRHASLNEAHMDGANIQNAYLDGTNLRDASLSVADFYETILTGADLQGANLENANLRNAYGIDFATFSEQTVLPDGTKWSEDLDMKKFTDPDHPDYWEPEWVRKAREEDGSD